jgi:hypothetical protein
MSKPVRSDSDGGFIAGGTSDEFDALFGSKRRLAAILCPKAAAEKRSASQLDVFSVGLPDFNPAGGGRFVR